MSIERTWEISSTSLEETLKIGAQVGQHLRGGEVIELLSDLGGGKTSFVKGLARGRGSQDIVHSPSFTISNQYQAGELTIYHFDFYRLNEPGILRNELAEIIEDLKAVVVVEWPDIAEAVIPPEHITLNIKVTGENSRQLIFKFPEKLNYLFPNT